MQREAINWIICEQLGRWSAALRVALDRRATSEQKLTHRIREVRTLAEYVSAINENPLSIGLVEIRSENLPAVLELIIEFSNRSIPIVALIDDPNCADTLYEAGAALVIESPRRIGAAINLATQIAAQKPSSPTHESASLADLARDALPWQPT